MLPGLTQTTTTTTITTATATATTTTTAMKKRNKTTQNNNRAKMNAATSSSASSATSTCSTSPTSVASTLTRNDKLEVQQKLRQRLITPRESSSTTTTTTTMTTTRTRKAKTTTSPTPTPATSFCSTTAAIAALVNCCRDVNCRFNALPCTSPPLQNGIYTCTEGYDYDYGCFIPHHERRSLSLDHGKSSPPTKFSSAPVPASTENAMARASVSSTASTTTTTPTTTRTSAAAAATQPNSALSNSISSGSMDDALSRMLESHFVINVDLDLFNWLLFLMAFCTRFYMLSTPAHIVFDELHYGKYVSHYMRRMFFFDQHPPLGKQLIAAVAHFAGSYDGNGTFPRIGAPYEPNVPIFWLRFLPALCGSLLSPVVYKLLLLARLNRWAALIGGLLVVFDNALLTQSRFILMESILLLFSMLGLCALLHFQRCRFGSIAWLLSGSSAAVLLTCATSVKYAGVFTYLLALYLMYRYIWDLLYDYRVTDLQIYLHTAGRVIMFTVIPVALYIAIFYIHLKTLCNAGPHDSAMTSAFQASLEGGLASITRGQPLKVVHGSQITLRHTHGRACWLHSHNHVYPVRYKDKRGSSHQQQVTCYSFKDVNNWWIVKRPDRDDLVVGDDPDPIKDGDIIQLVHGITSRGLNSHDVAAPVTPQCQEVSCYIDYKINMEPEMLWRVKILNKDTEGSYWHAIKSQIQLIHTTTGAALRFSGRQLPDWGFNQHEIVADRAIDSPDTIWNVEEHRYTQAHDERERERQLLNAEMLPTKKTKLSFWDKFIELQSKMLWNVRQIEGHMYSSEPYEWPLLDKGIAYWIDGKSNGQIHLLGNISIWYSSTIAIVIYAILGLFYMVRRRRLCYDIEENEWKRFLEMRDLYFIGYLFHYLPYFLMDRTLFLHNYLPALLFKIQLLCFVLEHIDYLLHRYGNRIIISLYRAAILIWLAFVIWVFWKFLPLSYGVKKLTVQEVVDLRWKDTWDFILQRNFNLAAKLAELAELK